MEYIEYYLDHERERNKIAFHGREKVVTEYLLENSIMEIFNSSC